MTKSLDGERLWAQDMESMSIEKDASDASVHPASAPSAENPINTPADEPCDLELTLETNENAGSMDSLTQSGDNSQIANDHEKDECENGTVLPPPVVGTAAHEEEPTSEENHERRVELMLSGSTGSEKIDKFSDDEIEIDEISESGAVSDSDPASDSCSDSDSDSDSESDNEPANGTNSSTKKGDSEIFDELEEEDEATTGPILSKNEVADEKASSLPADYTVPESAPLEYIGDICSLVENSAIIKANVSGEFRILKDNSILCFEDRQLLGPLFETFGRLQAPNYRVKFNAEEEFEKVKEKKGCKVYYVVPDSQFLYTDSIKKFKGTDASNCHDEELPEEEQEYSDDEQELAAKQAKTRKRKQKKQGGGAAAPARKKNDAPKPECSFLSYGFAQRQPAVGPPSASSTYLQLHHHNPVLHGQVYPQAAQTPSAEYGAPYDQLQGTAYAHAQPLANHPFAAPQYLMQQQSHLQTYMQTQLPQQQHAYAPPSQFGQYPHPQAYQSPYGKPNNPGVHAQQQFQHPTYGAPQYAQSYHPHIQPQPQLQGLPQGQVYPGQQHTPSIHPLLPPMPPQGQPQTQTCVSKEVPSEALQQLQQMVSRNLTKEKQQDEN